ncbi:helix-turn-helix domain-containing protein [Dactylosporangium sp. CA-052675]|uniref:helix-turn-helix domain-containing protein n=1 Tax=Dactylosporangium sp. CA-052675 TaxID=3239927 RepID=UPI003D9151B5
MAEASNEAIDRFYADVGQRIRDARAESGATQSQVAARAGLTRSSIANIEAGRQRVPLHVLAMVAEVLGVEPQSLFSIEMLLEGSIGMSVLSLRLEGEDPADREFIEGAIMQLNVSMREGSDDQPGN